jgi:hypothetical protein
MAETIEIQLGGQQYAVVTVMGDEGYEAACTCGWRAVQNENWVVVSSQIVEHFNTHIVVRA